MINVTVPSPPDHLVQQIQALNVLEVIHRSWSAAEAELEATIGRSVCVEGCALCCRHNCVTALGVEIDYAASWLATQSHAHRERVLRRIRQWLDMPYIEIDTRYHTQRAKIKPRKGILTMFTKEDYAALAPELLDTLHSLCPLMGDDKLCLIHPVRPMSCRAYGVTRLPAHYCKRPAGLGETEESRAIVEGDLSLEMQSQIDYLYQTMRGNAHLTMWSFLATGLYRRFRSNDLLRMAPNIPTVKLIQGAVSGAMLFQSQDDSQALTGSFHTASPLGRIKLEVL